AFRRESIAPGAKRTQRENSNSAKQSQRHIAQPLPNEATARFRAAAWRLEKTNPLWTPAKENKGVASRRESIAPGAERTQRKNSNSAKQSQPAASIAQPLPNEASARRCLATRKNEPIIE